MGAPERATWSRVLLSWLPAALYMLLIWWLSSQTFPLTPQIMSINDKLLHTAEYGMLGLLMAHAMAGTNPSWSRTRLWCFGLLLTVFWGMLDEIHQAFVPGRNADIRDLLADTLGGAAGSAFREYVLSRWSIFQVSKNEEQEPT